MENVATLFNLSSFLQTGEVYHIARVNITSKQDLTYHYHDYAELLWVESGTGIHHINGDTVRLSEGDMVMIRPEDRHTFSSSGEGLTIVNIAFSKETLDYFKNRYFPNSSQFFWYEGKEPFMIRIPDRLLKRISSRAEDAMKKPRVLLQQDSLLLFIFRHIVFCDSTEEFKDMPNWLINAINIYNTPDNFAKGIDHFAALCERSKDHVNRVVKHYLDKTLIGLITDIKLQYAIAQLSMTSMPIKEISVNCGYNNLGHFYKIFYDKYRMTPKQYRSINQKIV